MAASIPLGDGYVALIDDADLPLVSPYQWRATVQGDADRPRVYAVTGNPRGDANPFIAMHRLIAGTPDGLETDHWNHDTLDNRRINLRVCTSSQNQANRRMNRNNRSGARGVSWHSGRKKWIATIRVDWRKIWLGRFDTVAEAAAAYEAAAKKYFGDFAACASRNSVYALAVSASLALAGCEADPIAARATLTELGFHGIALSRAPLTGRPYAWGEPFAVRYRAVTEDGRIVNGILCSADEATEDARLLPDVEGGR